MAAAVIRPATTTRAFLRCAIRAVISLFMYLSQVAGISALLHQPVRPFASRIHVGISHTDVGGL
jgi:hypothetical protein